MPDLAEWLETAIGELEQAAELATTGPWVATSHGFVDVVPSSSSGAFVASAAYAYPDGSSDPILQADAEHIALNDPAAVLRRCAADRKILDLVRRGIAGHPGPCVNDDDQDPADYTPRDSCERHIEWSKTAIMDPAVQQLVLDALAEGYGYQEVAVHG